MTQLTVPSARVGEPVPDVLGEDYEAMPIELPDDRLGPVGATLVRRRAPLPSTRAVLYVHGYVDYFFQTALADFHVQRGSDFYAVDLRRYGRSLRPGQTAWAMSEISDYAAELDAALSQIEADGHQRVTVVAHSTGGLIVALWLAQRGTLGPVDSVVLNSPFLEVNAHSLVKLTVGTGADALARIRPAAVLPIRDLGLYGRSIHATQDGEWTFDTTWKPLIGAPVHVGWLAAIRRAHRKLARNLGLTCPILVLCSSRTFRGTKFSEDIYRGDAVLDADRIADLSTRLGRHVTCVRIPDGMHDLFLSREQPRQAAYDAMRDWLDRYGC